MDFLAGSNIDEKVLCLPPDFIFKHSTFPCDMYILEFKQHFATCIVASQNHDVSYLIRAVVIGRVGALLDGNMDRSGLCYDLLMLKVIS